MSEVIKLLDARRHARSKATYATIADEHADSAEAALRRLYAADPADEKQMLMAWEDVPAILRGEKTV